MSVCRPILARMLAAGAAALLPLAASAQRVNLCQYPPDAANSSLLPVDCGESCTTQFSGHDGTYIIASQPVLGVFDLRVPFPTGAIRNICPPTWRNLVPSTGNSADRWTAENLGQVFGVMLDDANPPNIYVAASTVYGSNNASYYAGATLGELPFLESTTTVPNGLFGPGGSGAVYRIDGATGAICQFLQTAGGAFHMADGTGLGDLAFDPAHDRIFVSDFDSGAVLCADASSCPGVFVGSFKHAGGAGLICSAGNCDLDITDFDNQFAPLGERIWGLGVHEGRLYYGLWVEDMGRTNPTRNNEVWSIDVSSGNFSGAPRFEFSVPFISGLSSSPVAGIAFSGVGRMMIAERTMRLDVGVGRNQTVTGSWGHRSAMLEYELVAGTWVPTNRPFRIDPGNSGTSSCGGVSYLCDDSPVGTGNHLIWNDGENCASGTDQVVYGVQICPPGGTGTSQSAIWNSSTFFDLNGDYNCEDKTLVGDVIVNRNCCECVQFFDGDILCEVVDGPEGPYLTGNYTYTFRFKNTSGSPIRRIAFPAGTPIVPSTITLGADVANNAISPPITVTITGRNEGEFCFDIRFFDANVVECCATNHCIDLPLCDCLQRVADPPYTVTCVDGGYLLTFEIYNLTGRPMNEVYLFPEPIDATFSVNPSSFLFDNPEFLHLETRTITTFISGASSGELIELLVSIHHDGVECCSRVLKFQLPDCGPPVDGCDADFDHDGFVTGLDFDLFVYAFEAGTPDADFDADGFVSGLDFDLFVAAFEKGC